MRSRTLLAISLTLGACALTHGPAQLAPLETEGELYVYLQPAASRRAAPPQLVSAAAIRGDGLEVPLRLEASSLAPGDRQRLLAGGRLSPGTYSSLELQTATRPLRIDAPFSIDERRATVLWLSGRGEGALPTPATPPRTVSPLASFCTDAAADDVLVFDKHLRAVTAALPTGRAPWGIALDPVQSRAYVALEGDDQLAMIDVPSAHELARIHLSPGDAPREVLLTSDRRWVVTANAGSNSVSLVDPAALAEIGRVQVGDQPTSLLADRRSARIYVFNARSSSISVVDPAARAVVATAQAENTPLRGQLDRAGTRLYVASPRAAQLTVYAVPSLTPVQRVYVGIGTTALKVDPDTDLLYVANADGRVSVFDPWSLLPVDSFDAGGAATWMSIDAAENVLFLLMPAQRAVSAFQLATRTPIAGFEVGPEARVLAIMGERN